ncbi:MAG: 2-oxoacid:acceptor oxidoreductase subunit alpha [Clostridia bacterium]|nr:2-oxoacid:acceptor oxidoreductase subunit alpha [Clostridia bacterium]
MYNLLIGGAAGQGIDTMVSILEKLLKKSGYHIFTSRDFMSRVRGGHNFSLLRFGSTASFSHSYKIDGIIALAGETIDIHKDKLTEGGFILCDEDIESNDERIIRVSMKSIAKDIGNSRVAGTVAAGAVLKIFGDTLDNAKEVLQDELDEKYVDINMQAISKGYELAKKRYEAKPGKYADCMILSGNQAIGLGAIAAGLRFYCAYPMSPSTSIMVYVASKAERAGIVVEQAEDEIAAINMAIGASFAGARAMTGTSGGGFSLMVEALGLAGIAEIPVVIANVQRPGPATGLPTRTEQSDLKFVVSASQGEFPRMVIAVRNHEDAFYQTVRAFDMAEKYQIPVIILSDQFLGDATASVKMFDTSGINTASPASEVKGEYLRYKLTDSGISPRLIPGKSKHLVAADSDEHDEHGRITESAEVRNAMVEKRAKKLELLKTELIEPDFLGDNNFENLIVGWGSTYGSILEAVEKLNEAGGKYAALVFGDVYPLPEKLLREKAAAAKKIIAVEQNATGQLAGIIREYTGIEMDEKILKYDGRQITADEIIDRLSKEAE